ncbi:MAG: response regulator [Dorea sp.]|jgi:two-component system sensor histidine kinase/response regulator|nr:response regulator [Dorea sp.]
MFRKTKRFLFVSMSCLVLLCVLIFLWLSSIMTGKSEEAINDVGKIYMSEMSTQLQQKFDAITASWVSQVEGIAKRTPPQEQVYGQAMLDDLALGASVREFEYLGLYTEDGEYEDVYGTPVTFLDEQEFHMAIGEEDKKITSGFNANDEKLLFFVIDAQYPMKGGKVSDVLVAGLPMSHLESALVLEEENSMVYSHIIRKDGKFVVRTGEAFRDNYFDRLRETISNKNQKNPETYVEEVQEAMQAEEEYSALLIVDDTHRHIYCAPLCNSEWYLVSIMPYGVLDDAILHLSDERQKTMVTAGGIILAALLVIFALYYRLTQQQLRELEKAEKAATSANKAKSEFLSSMSHDIRTPMNGIVGMTAIAIANVHDMARVQDCLKKISLSSRHLLGLINDVLDMSKIESGKLSLNIDILSLRDVMENIVNIVQPQIKEKRQHFDIFIQDIESEEVCCDGVRLNQILVNLLSNAIKFTPEEGTINVYLFQEESPKGSDYVRCHFRVRDNGIGMSPEFQKKIFETFSREDTKVQKIEGTGLGMAITKFIVSMMGGTIEVESEQGKGSEFHVIIDFERATIQEVDMVLPSWRLLVVDNNEDLCRSATSALKEIGVQAEWVLDGEKALRKIEENHKRNTDYEIVLLDWKMPGMNGLETTRGIRKIVGDGLPILIISAYDWSDIEDEARAAGVQGFISKPLFKSNLYLGLSRYVEGAPDEDEQVNALEEERDFGGLRILLAEDNDLNWEIAEDILTDVGFEVEWAENGKICVEKFEQSAPGYYDAVLMDIRMPVMNGYDAAKAIRALNRADARLPIIAMTADAFSEDIQRCLECGMNEHVAKPIDIEKLMKLLKRYLG